MNAQSIEQYRHGKLTLVEFIHVHGRKGAAKIIGCTPPALTKALGAGRTIFVELAADGSVDITEISKFPCR